MPAQGQLLKLAVESKRYILMFQHLKLMPYKALKEEQLRDLGKINVICGQNSSGKSTLMEAISSVNKRQVGKRMTEAVITQIFDQSRKVLPWTGARKQMSLEMESGLNRMAAAHQDVIEKAAGTQDVWYPDSVSSFLMSASSLWESVEMFKTRVRTTLGESIEPTRLPSGEIMDSYNSLFAAAVPTILVPPKRQIELSCPLSLNEPINNDGSGLLRYLFFAKNQATGTEDKNTFDSVANAFAKISGGHHFEIFPTQANTINLHFAYQQEPWRPAQDCGLGLQDLLVLLYFAVTPKYQVVLVEEAESHLHPEWQRKLLAFLRDTADKQFFLTTHSNIFLDAGMVDKVFFTTLDGSIKVDDATGRATILADLGYSVTDNLVSDLILLVEGPSDLQVLEEALIKMGLYGDFNIKIWSLGGDNMAQLDLSVFAEHYSIMALVDNDPKSGHVRETFMEKCAELNIPVTRLKRYAMENYFTLRAVNEVYRKWGNKVPDTVTSVAPEKPLDEQIGFNVKRNNREIAQEMTMEEFQATDDLYEFLLSVERKLESN